MIPDKWLPWLKLTFALDTDLIRVDHKETMFFGIMTYTELYAVLHTCMHANDAVTARVMSNQWWAPIDLSDWEWTEEGFIKKSEKAVQSAPQGPPSPCCECGTKAKMGQNHSSWCDMYVKELP